MLSEAKKSKGGKNKPPVGLLNSRKPPAAGVAAGGASKGPDSLDTSDFRLAADKFWSPTFHGMKDKYTKDSDSGSIELEIQND